MRTLFLNANQQNEGKLMNLVFQVYRANLYGNEQVFSIHSP